VVAGIGVLDVAPLESAMMLTIASAPTVPDDLICPEKGA
jgi:hypothetical protein